MVFEVLHRHGVVVNRKRIKRILRKLGLKAIVLWRNTSAPHHEHTKYPYLLRDMKITRPNQVWASDIHMCELRTATAIWMT